jgi:hypothetical protein
LLIANRSNPTVKLERSWQIDKALPDEGLGVNDGEVFVSAGGDTIDYVNVQGKSGFWNSVDSFVVCPTVEYRLSVSVPGEQRIYAETIVPDTFSIIMPEQGDTLDEGGYLPFIVWPMNLNAAGYIVDIFSRIDSTHFSVMIGEKDTLFPIFPFFLGDSGEHVIRVVAVDENYLKYCGQRGGGPHGDEETGEDSGIIGGLGVFGSCVVESVQVYVK